MLERGNDMRLRYDDTGPNGGKVEEILGAGSASSLQMALDG